jgi:YhcH/YjgK/YiaL family protein
MKISGIFPIVAIAIVFTFAGKVSAQTDSLKMAQDWLKSKVWAKGLNIDVYSDINALEFYRQYHKDKAMWDKAFAYLADAHKLDTLKAGMYPIDGKNVYASITEGPEKTEETARWESHRKYIDLQYVIRGKEKIGVAQVSTAIVINPYDDARDAANYTANGKYYIATPVVFYLFFPSDAHKPNIHVDGYDTVKKIVIKIRYVQ